MPQATVSVEVPLPPAQVLAAVQDLDFLVQNLPEVKHVERVDQRTALLTVELKLGLLRRRTTFRSELLEVTPEVVRFQATAPEATVAGSLQIRPLGEQGSRVDATIEMNGRGALAAVINNALERRVKDEAGRFAEALRNRLLARTPADEPRGESDSPSV